MFHFYIYLLIGQIGLYPQKKKQAYSFLVVKFQQLKYIMVINMFILILEHDFLARKFGVHQHCEGWLISFYLESHGVLANQFLPTIYDQQHRVKLDFFFNHVSLEFDMLFSCEVRDKIEHHYSKNKSFFVHNICPTFLCISFQLLLRGKPQMYHIL